ncbi:NAD(P)-binding protein, partial [Ophiobolus disseminans]
ILIFGPTGAVGRAAAIEAHRRGAHIWLAMRDTSKAIPGLDDSDPRYTRLYADLSEPSTVRSAVEESGATSAFVYTLFSSPDAMASSFAALKAGGITYVVLLSSFLVQGLASDEKNMQSFLPRVHSSTESALYVSAIPYAALRPWYFNSNVLWYTAGIKNSAVDLLYPELKHDYLAPSDIGIV